MVRVSLLIFFSIYVLLPNFGSVNLKAFHRNGVIKLEKKHESIQKIPIKKSNKKLLKKELRDIGPLPQEKKSLYTIDTWYRWSGIDLEDPFIRKVAIEDYRVLRN